MRPLLKETAMMKLIMHLTLTLFTGGLWLIVLGVKFLIK
jgi:hypothetical protein